METPLIIAALGLLVMCSALFGYWLGYGDGRASGYVARVYDERLDAVLKLDA